ncbi:hypothetical protein [Absidia glauca]|uniref:GATA-type domain-containing protein n=1 Tax=Absidia glauca TaxID=4829 RepID=A0A168KZN0_ABSGL|nr:hypothetical protein [Absidia glauca]
MAPILLKLQGVSDLLDDLNVDSDELHDAWRVCTKAKQALENGSRLENMSWRRWFRHVHKQHEPTSPLLVEQQQSEGDEVDQQHEPGMAPTANLEKQYKRNLLLQQKDQYQRLLLAAVTVEATTTPTKSLPEAFDDPQYQPPPQCPPTVSAPGGGPSIMASFGNMDDKTGQTIPSCDPYAISSDLTICQNNSNSSSNSDIYNSIHPAMYVSFDESPQSQQSSSYIPPFDPYQQPSSSINLSLFTTSTFCPASITTTAASALSSSSFASYPIASASLTVTTAPTTQPTTKKPKKHRIRRPLPAINADGNGKSICDDCGTSATPLWRRYQNKNLCNACGL